MSIIQGIEPAKSIGGQAALVAHLSPVFELDDAHLQANQIVAFNNRDSNSRQFSLLRTQILKRAQEKGWKLIGITSPAPGAGKSFVAANLAASLSRLPSRKTYLFDFDLRRGTQAHNFGIEGGLSLTEYLAGETDDLNACGRRVGETNLVIYPWFGQNFDSFEILAGECFAKLISTIRALPDDALVICDLPPAFANDDAMMLGQKLDAYLLVVEQGITKQQEVQDCIRLMEPTPCIGSVLNRFEGNLADLYGYGYKGKYSDYYSSPE